MPNFLNGWLLVYLSCDLLKLTQKLFDLLNRIKKNHSIILMFF
jgi:hypothetical protein